MQIKADTDLSIQNLSLLSSYAQFLLSHRLEEYVKEQVRLSRQYQLPLLKYFHQMSDEEFIILAWDANKEFLTNLANNNARLFIENSVQSWVSNQLPTIDKMNITAEDITLGNFIRKKGLLNFIVEYCRDAEQIIELIKEIDFFILESETAFTNTLIRLLHEDIEEHTLLLQKINNTVPGAVFIFDVEVYKGVYSNHKLSEIIGYNHEELNELNDQAIIKLIHPDDQENLKLHTEALKKLEDGKIKTIKYRILRKEGGYKWISAYETVFKRRENGSVWQTIGIILDIDKEQKANEEVKEWEKRLLEAQEMANMGSFYWDFANKELNGTPKTFSILETTQHDIENFLQKVHTDDQQKIEKELSRAFETGIFECTFRINGEKGLKTIWSKGAITYSDGKAKGMTGTVMDITERQQILDELNQSEHRYKQAEAITHIGNYEWDLRTNEIKWSDELFRIYGLTPLKTSIKSVGIRQFNHPEDNDNVDKSISEAIKNKSSFDFYYRIIIKDQIKILHARGEVFTDKDGNATKILGTAQDVTEKQTLIRTLREKEAVYKQSEELANMGNWTWNMKTQKLQWSDQLYRIYGMEPQSEKMTHEKFLSFVHPDDKPLISEGVQIMEKEQYLDYTFRIITRQGIMKTLRSIAHMKTDDSGKPVTILGIEHDITEKQLLIDQLKQSEANFKQAQALAHVGNWSFNITTGIGSWSEELYRIYELPYGEVITLDFVNSFIHPEEKEAVVTYLGECILQKKIYDKAHRIVLRNGKIKTIHRRAQVVEQDGHSILIGTTQDVTNLDRIQQELKDNQTFIQKITDATPSIIASYNVNTGKYVFISEGLGKLLGYDRSDVDKQGVSFFINIVHPDDLKAITEKNERVLSEANRDPLRNDLITEFTYRMRNKSGDYRWFHTYGTIFDRNSEGKVEHILNITLDITEQVEATQKIEEQEHFIQQIADASPTILYLFDVEQQKIVYINREIFFVLGYLPEEIVEAGANITEFLYHPQDYQLLPGRRESNKSFQQVDSMMQYECRMKNKEGQWRWLLVREIVFKSDDQGNIKQILGAALDINRRKEMEKTILQNTLQLEQSNASLEEFAYVASHDLKEPLRKISTFGDRLVASQADRLTPEGKIYLNKIVDASQRMQTMISDLLSISMISGNLDFEMYSLQKILDEVLQTLEFKIEQKNAIIKADELPEARIIPSQFRQLFQNLLSNSLKFVREDVQPVIHIRHEFLTQNEVTHYQVIAAPNYNKIEFKDNGIGFENEYAGKIFAIFQRLHGRSEYEGSGIGLAICKKIVEHHGGVIYANGTPGEGATFTIILPA